MLQTLSNQTIRMMSKFCRVVDLYEWICSNLAVKSPEWDDEFCSDECAVGHCKDVFGIWVSEQPQG